MGPLELDDLWDKEEHCSGEGLFDIGLEQHVDQLGCNLRWECPNGESVKDVFRSPLEFPTLVLPHRVG